MPHRVGQAPMMKCMPLPSMERSMQQRKIPSGLLPA
jgi:hypothetical protein